VNDYVNWSLLADDILWFVIISGIGLNSIYLLALCIFAIIVLIILEQYNKKCILSNEEWCIFTKQVASIAVLFYIAKLFYNLSE
jgi:hypothetical protein